MKVKEMTYKELEKELKEIQAFLNEETSAIGRNDMVWEQQLIKELDKRDKAEVEDDHDNSRPDYADNNEQ